MAAFRKRQALENEGILMLEFFGGKKGCHLKCYVVPHRCKTLKKAQRGLWSSFNKYGIIKALIRLINLNLKQIQRWGRRTVGELCKMIHEAVEFQKFTVKERSTVLSAGSKSPHRERSVSPEWPCKQVTHFYHHGHTPSAWACQVGEQLHKRNSTNRGAMFPCSGCVGMCVSTRHHQVPILPEPPAKSGCSPPALPPRLLGIFPGRSLDRTGAAARLLAHMHAY